MKITSIFLFLLFCIVIAFPGYGNPNSAQKKQTIMFADDHHSMPSLLVALKKCLAKGINIIEEERNTEEEDASHSGCLVFFENTPYLFLNISFIQTISFISYHQPAYTSVCMNVFTPPDCFISC